MNQIQNRFQLKNWPFLPILRFSKSISAELGDSKTLFSFDCQSSYNTVALYAVWKNLDQNWHFRGDLNIEVCLNLKHKKLISHSASQTRNQMFPTLCFFVSTTCAVAGQLVFFRSHSLFDHTGLEHAHTFEKLTKFSIFQNSNICKTRPNCSNSSKLYMRVSLE